MRQVLSFAGDPVATAAALCASSGEPYFLYEHGGAVSWAEGERAVVEAGSRVVRAQGPSGAEEFSVSEGRLPAIGAALRWAGVAGRRAYGWLAWELAESAEDSTVDEEPVARFFLPSREVFLSPGEAVVVAGTAAELDELARRVRTAAVRAHEPVPSGRIAVAAEDHGAAEYRDAVDAAVRAIRAGELQKVILSRAVPVPGRLDLPATYVAGRRGNDPARSFLLRLGGWEAAGFSPEIVARVDARGEVSTQPLAGTRALTGDPVTDAARRGELYCDAKEVFEHAVSVRLAAEELAGFCAPGTVRVRDFMTVKERGSVQHLASELAGELAPGKDAWDALAGLFPAVTASGIPKRQARALAGRLEPGRRGLYSGAAVVVGEDGTLDAALVLRSVFRRDGETWLRAGAGVVADSVPERELEETREKLASVSRFLVPAGSPVEVAS